MNTLVRFIEVLAWPATVLVLVYALRSELRKILERLSELKYGSFVATFGRQLEEAHAELKQIEAETTTTSTTSTTPNPGLRTSSFDTRYSETLTTLFRIAQLSPRAAVAEAWRYVELAARTAANRLGITMIGSMGESRAIHTLADKGTLPLSAISLFERLRQMRNDAVHSRGNAIHTEDAQNYIELALRFADELDSTARC